jgi:hypothetical protein
MSPVKLLAMAMGGTIPTAKRFERHAFAYFWQDKSMDQSRSKRQKKFDKEKPSFLLPLLLIRCNLSQVTPKFIAGNNGSERT